LVCNAKNTSFDGELPRFSFLSDLQLNFVTVINKEGIMKFTKGLAFFGIVMLGLSLFAMVFYQSGLLQKIQKNNGALALKAVTANKLSKKPSDKGLAPLTNPNGDTAIAIIQHHRPLENTILEALDKGAFTGRF
jgi:hypothetical protein